MISHLLKERWTSVDPIFNMMQPLSFLDLKQHLIFLLQTGREMKLQGERSVTTRPIQEGRGHSCKFAFFCKCLPRCITLPATKAVHIFAGHGCCCFFRAFLPLHILQKAPLQGDRFRGQVLLL